ncbi:hypothetical protein [Trichoplusia ni ascovirus 2c]|uniref:hypothetical protein n=1 Tax=Trichoplusia ni ascovirus 2c TaxID=328615 RepID=UPI0000E44217|nr:hypothetical protein TNAV2c_gp063 [Trichoplusia ni ascovirus 2c]ABF70580.1 hypothetical protein [Trichoplusia ni ascovirus 2c]AUS94167.1 hypothetical protein [Trichoplusia ni ascovirus 6b]
MANPITFVVLVSVVVLSFTMADYRCDEETCSNTCKNNSLNVSTTSACSFDNKKCLCHDAITTECMNCGRCYSKKCDQLCKTNPWVLKKKLSVIGRCDYSRDRCECFDLLTNSCTNCS